MYFLIKSAGSICLVGGVLLMANHFQKQYFGTNLLGQEISKEKTYYEQQEKKIEKSYIVKQTELQKQTRDLEKDYKQKQKDLQQKISKLESTYSDLEKTIKSIENRQTNEISKQDVSKTVNSRFQKDSIYKNIKNYFSDIKSKKLIQEKTKKEALANYQKLSLEYSPIKIQE